MSALDFATLAFGIAGTLLGALALAKPRGPAPPSGADVRAAGRGEKKDSPR